MGTSPDGPHRELGVAIELPTSHARSLAIQIPQSAFFWFDDDFLWTRGAIVDSAPLHSPVMPQSVLRAV